MCFELNRGCTRARLPRPPGAAGTFDPVDVVIYIAHPPMLDDAARPSIPIAGPTTERAAVWVLEDSPFEAELARRGLASMYDVQVFAEGSTVLERIANEAPPEVLVVDWQLPHVSGLDVCRFLRATYDEMDLPIIIVTAYGNKQEVVEGLAAGANDFLSKPYDPDELKARISTLVKTGRLNQSQKRKSTQLAMTADVAIALTRSRSLDAAARECVSAIAAKTADSAVAVFIADQGVLREAAKAGGAMNLRREYLPEEGVVGRIATARRPLVVRSVREGAAEASEIAGELSAVVGPGSFVGLPLMIDAQLLGVLIVSTQRPLHADSVDALKAVADVVTLGLDRTRAEQERAALLDRELLARSEVEKANLLKDQFLATVSHELRTPLNAISGWSHLLRAGTLSPTETGRALETIERNAQVQTQLVEDLLDVSRIVSGKLRVSMSSVSLVTVIQNAVASVAPTARSKSIHVECHLDPGGRWVHGDADRLQQVIWNLLSNAVKFTPSGGRVDIDLTREGAAAVVRVKDSGMGLAADSLPLVFERFRQVEGSLSRKQSGLGLGLAICRHLVELHGGTIHAESEGEGRGATFVFSLPVLEDGERLHRARTESKPSNESTLVAGLRVLVVEDDPSARDLLSTMLKQWQIDVTLAATAAEGFEQLRRSAPDLLISDVGMPGEDGLSLIRKIRSLPAEAGGFTPAIAVTAYARPDDRKRALMAGFNMHVPKPVDAGHLLIVMASLAGRSL